MSLRVDDRGSGVITMITLLASLVAVAVVAGLIAAGLAMPAIGAAGATARGGVGFFDALPAEFEQSPLSQQSRILYSDGSTLATFYSENRIIVPLAKVAPIMRKAQVAIEDDRFYEHGGVDMRGVVRAAVRNASSDSTQGASTLTQQYVKLTNQENAVYAGDKEAAAAAVRKDYSRKLSEMKTAIALEKKVSKNQILEGYLNIAYFGDGAYGVETAARHFFGVHADKLTLAQASLLAGLVQQPSRFDPTTHPEAAVTRRNQVLDRMLQTKVITQAQHDSAVKIKLKLKITKTSNGCDQSKAAFFCNYVVQVLTKDGILAKTPAAATQRIQRGGLTIKTTIDKKMQLAAQKSVSDKVAAKNKSNVAAALSVVEPGTGNILAMAQSRPYGRSKGQTDINYNTDQPYGGSGGFQMGSTFKAFTLAAALDDGMALSSNIYAPRAGTPFPSSDFDSGACWPTDLSQGAGVYKPDNAESGEVGNYSLQKVTADSVNTAFVALEAKVGVCKVKKVADNLGMHGAVTSTDGLTNVQGDDAKPTNAIRPRGSMTLGAQPVAPLTVAAAYAGFAADGVFCKPVAITSIKTLAGKAIPAPKKSCGQAIDKNVARGVTAALQTVITHGTAAGKADIGRPAAGKTGTSNSSQNLWFAGYTPQLAAAVWFGNPDRNKAMRGIDTGKGYFGSQMYGATLSAPIWAEFMRSALSGKPVEPFGKADDHTIYGDRVSVPQTFGMSVDEARSTLTTAGFSVTVGKAANSPAPAGAVAGSSPAAGSRVTTGSSITIYPSKGPRGRPTNTGGPVLPGGPGTTQDPRGNGNGNQGNGNGNGNGG